MPEAVDVLQPLRIFAETLPTRERRDIVEGLAGGAGVLAELTERHGEENLDADEEPLHDLLTSIASAVALDVAVVADLKREAHLDAAGLTDAGHHIVFCANVLDTTLPDLETIATSGIALPGRVVSRLRAQATGVEQLALAAVCEEMLEPGPTWVVLDRRPKHVRGPVTRR